VKSTVVKGLYGEEALRLSVAAPPVGGRANAEAEHYLAALIADRGGEITGRCGQGVASPDKVVLVEGVKSETVQEGLVGLVR
jgi:uncharacterized protein YggU (UPF0235/DUF167 family)